MLTVLLELSVDELVAGETRVDAVEAFEERPRNVCSPSSARICSLGQSG